MRTYESGRMGWAMLPASSGNCACRRRETSSIRLTALEFMSELNSCSTAGEPMINMEVANRQPCSGTPGNTAPAIPGPFQVRVLALKQS